ncbi:MAG: hypothetical protein HQL39_03640 [Alphaproteobacteria bacterium]|nr:hypothetical protein [Alphaproteobacteria bacterium]
MDRPSTRTLVVLLTAGLAIGAVWKYFQNFPQVWDIHLWDETLYMWAGLDPAATLPGPYEASGLYSMFYRLLGRLIADPVDLYHWGGLVVVGSALGALFLTLLAVSRLPAVAVIGTTLFLVSGAAMSWPRVTLGALAVIGLWVAAAHRLPLGSKLATATLAAFLGSFIRPEFSLSFVLLLPAALAVPLWERLRHRRSPGIWWALPLGLVLLLSVLWMVPLPQGGGRAFFAFAQHYALHTVTKQGLAIDPGIEWKTFTDAAFPGATSLAGAMLANPGAFATFLLANLVGTGEAFANFFFHHFVGQSWGSGLPRRMAATVLFGVAAAAVLGCRLAALRHGWSERNRDLATGAILLLFAFPVVLSCVLIYPREHYLVTLLFVALVLMGLLTGAAGRATGPVFWLGPVVALAAVVLTPVRPPEPQPTLAVIQALRQAKPVAIGAMAELDGRWCAYLDPPCRFVGLDRWSGTPPLPELMTAEKADALMISPRLLSIPRFAGDPWLAGVLADPTAAGFRAVPLPHGHLLLVGGADRVAQPGFAVTGQHDSR